MFGCPSMCHIHRVMKPPERVVSNFSPPLTDLASLGAKSHFCIHYVLPIITDDSQTGQASSQVKCLPPKHEDPELIKKKKARYGGLCL